jgi:RsmE family RNA methyltransferase
VNLVLLDPIEILDASVVRLTGRRALHLLRVLNITVGKPVRVGMLELRCEFHETPPRPPVDLLLALPRPKVMRRLWSQLAAIGVGRIILTNAERVERNYFDSHVLAPDTYRPLLLEGLQQARDTRVPVVSIHRQFRVLVEDELDPLCPADTRLVAHPGEKDPIRAVLHAQPGARVLLAIGPEGGWNDFELNLLSERGFLPIGIGPRSLRSDTACVALLAMVNEVLRDAG